jgi:pimeloyl-ACP methyl ester carboxylesterase
MLSALSSLHKSTNVRNQKYPTLRFFLQNLQRVSPSMSAAVAEKLFCTPKSPRKRSREEEALLLASPLPVVIGGRRLAAWQWGDGPTILLVHGWGGRAAQLTGFVDPLVFAGFRVVAVDMPAHGDSEGTQATLADFADAVYATAAAAGGVDGIICHSFGAAAVMVALSRGLSVERVVMVAPVGPLAAGIDYFCDTLGLTEETRQLFFQRLSLHNGMSVPAIDRDALLPKMSAPLLVLHDQQDQEVPLHHSESLAQQWRGARLVKTIGLGHNRILWEQDVIQQATSFVTRSALQKRPYRLGDEFEALHLW